MLLVEKVCQRIKYFQVQIKVEKFLHSMLLILAVFHVHWQSVQYFNSRVVTQPLLFEHHHLTPPPIAICIDVFYLKYFNKVIKYDTFGINLRSLNRLTGNEIVRRLPAFEESILQIRVKDENFNTITYAGFEQLQQLYKRGQHELKNGLMIRRILFFKEICYEFLLRLDGEKGLRRSKIDPIKRTGNLLSIHLPRGLSLSYVVFKHVDMLHSYATRQPLVSNVIVLYRQSRTIQISRSDRLFQKLNERMHLPFNQKCEGSRLYTKLRNHISSSIAVRKNISTFFPLDETYFNTTICNKLDSAKLAHQYHKNHQDCLHPWMNCNVEYSYTINRIRYKPKIILQKNLTYSIRLLEKMQNLHSVLFELKFNPIEKVYIRSVIVNRSEFLVCLCTIILFWWDMCVLDLLAILEKTIIKVWNYTQKF